MKILIVSGFFYPQNTPRAFRTTELVKEFVRQGHEVTVYIPKCEFDYSGFLKEFNSQIKFFDNIDERRRFIGVSIIDRIIFRFLNQFLAYPTIKGVPRVLKALENERGYDLLITIAVPHYTHWALGKLYQKGKKAAKVWVADCGDPFMLARSGSYNPPFYFKPLEKRWCRLCDYISVPTETSYMGYYPEFRNKIKVIPQGFNFSDIGCEEYHPNSVPTFAFAGSFIPGRRDPRELLRYLNGLKEDFRFIVFTPNGKDRWGDLVDKSNGRVVFERPMPRVDLLRVLSQMDFLINIGNGTNVQTPSKLIDYTLAKRPIMTVETNDIKENVLREFLEGNYEHKDVELDISKYDIKNVTQQFLDLCKLL